MRTYVYLLTLCSFIISCHGGASSSNESTEQGKIVLIDNPKPNGLHFYESYQRNNQNEYSVNNAAISNPNHSFYYGTQDYGLYVRGRIISEEALQNARRKQGFPTQFTIRCRRQDGTWYCGDHYVLPKSFQYRDLDESTITIDQFPESIRARRHIHLGNTLHNIPVKKISLPHVDQQQSLPEDISIYLELNRFDGPLLSTVGDYFRCFPMLRYLSLRRRIGCRALMHTYAHEGKEHIFNSDVLDPALTFLRIQEQKDSAERFNNRNGSYENFLREQSELHGCITWRTIPALPIGDIPAWPAQCIRTQSSLTLLECMKLTPPISPHGRIIDLRGHTIDAIELQNVPGEGSLFVLNYEQQAISPAQITEINNHFAQQCPWHRRYLDTLYKYRYHLAAGATAAVAATYMYHNHGDLVAQRAQEIAPLAEQLDQLRKAHQSLGNLMRAAQDKQTVDRMTIDEMRSVINAQIDIKTVANEWRRLKNAMPYAWTLLHSFMAAIKNKVGTITGITLGTYLADVYIKYFLGYRPYQPSSIHVQNKPHDYFYDKIIYSEVDIEPYDGGRYTQRGYCCHECDIATFYQHKPRNFDALLPHYDEATEARFKRNQSLATLGASVGIPFAALLWLATKQSK